MNIPPIGFIGTGNMGSALARAVRRALPEAELFCSNRGPEKAQALAQELGGRAVSGEEAAWQCGLLFLGVKPNGIPGLLESLARPLTQREDPPLLVSMAAGVGLDQLEDLAPRCPVVRIMPNTPVSIGQGVTLYTCGQRAKKEDRELVLAALAQSGSLVEIPESQMEAAGVVAGCGPAFVDLFLEALADGGVACGLPRAQALEFAAQMALADGGVFCGLPRALALTLAAEMTAGAARLALESGKHPGALKDAVCSPGGSTIRGVRELERAGLRGGVIEAVLASAGER